MCEQIHNKEYVTPLFENPIPVLSKIANTFYEEVSVIIYVDGVFIGTAVHSLLAINDSTFSLMFYFACM